MDPEQIIKDCDECLTMRLRCTRHAHCHMCAKNEFYPDNDICHFCFEKGKRCDWSRTDKFHFDQINEDWINDGGEIKDYDPFKNIYSSGNGRKNNHLWGAHVWRNNQRANVHNQTQQHANVHNQNQQHDQKQEKRRKSKAQRKRERNIALLTNQHTGENVNRSTNWTAGRSETSVVEYNPTHNFHELFHLDAKYIA